MQCDEQKMRSRSLEFHKPGIEDAWAFLPTHLLFREITQLAGVATVL